MFNLPSPVPAAEEVRYKHFILSTDPIFSTRVQFFTLFVYPHPVVVVSL